VPKTKSISLSAVIIDRDLQAREGIDDNHVEDIAQAIKSRENVKPPRVMEVLDRDSKLFAIDQHRLLAYREMGREKAPVQLLTGNWQDARDLATSSNAEHNALKRSRQAKERAVLMTLEDHPDWTDGKIAKHVRVSAGMVADHRPQVEKAASVPLEKRVGADNKRRAYKAKASKNGKPAVMFDADDPDRFEPILNLLLRLSTEINAAINSDGGENLMKYLTYYKLIVYPNKTAIDGESVEYKPKFKGFPGIRRLIRYAALPGRARTEAQVRAEFARKEDGE
jgi:hypothetical protein